MPKKGKSGKPITKNRFIPKMFLRGDSVIYILKNPNWFYILCMTLLSVIIKSKFIKMYKNKKLNLDTLNKKISGEIEDPDNTSSIIPISESPDES